MTNEEKEVFRKLLEAAEKIRKYHSFIPDVKVFLEVEEAIVRAEAVLK